MDGKAKLGETHAISRRPGEWTSITTHLARALRAGLAAILVRTGKYRTEALEQSGLEPTAVVDSIADVPALFGA